MFLFSDSLDRYIMIGSPRASLPGQSHDVTVSTSVLTQLAHGMKYVHDLDEGHWRPRRGIKMISWGGAELSNAGIICHMLVSVFFFIISFLVYILLFGSNFE